MWTEWRNETRLLGLQNHFIQRHYQQGYGPSPLFRTISFGCSLRNGKIGQRFPTQRYEDGQYASIEHFAWPILKISKSGKPLLLAQRASRNSKDNGQFPWELRRPLITKRA